MGKNRSHRDSAGVIRALVIRALDWLGALGFSYCVVRATLWTERLLHVTGEGHSQLSLVLVVAGGLLVGWFLADALSGLVHYLADNCGSPEWPFFGPAFIRPFREHHQHPETILRHDFLERNGSSALIATLPLLPLAMADHMPELFVLRNLPPLSLLGFTTASLALASMISITNQIHAWAHASERPGVVRALQNAGIILSPRAHARHHHPPFNTHYCITSGIVDKIWRRDLASSHPQMDANQQTTKRSTAKMGEKRSRPPSPRRAQDHTEVDL